MTFKTSVWPAYDKMLSNPFMKSLFPVKGCKKELRHIENLSKTDYSFNSYLCPNIIYFGRAPDSEQKGTINYEKDYSQYTGFHSCYEYDLAVRFQLQDPFFYFPPV